MKVHCGYEYNYAGTENSWEEEIPEEVVEEGSDAIEEYLEGLRQQIWDAACERVSIWATIIEEEEE